MAFGSVGMNVPFNGIIAKQKCQSNVPAAEEKKFQRNRSVAADGSAATDAFSGWNRWKVVLESKRSMKLRRSSALPFKLAA